MLCAIYQVTLPYTWDGSNAQGTYTIFLHSYLVLLEADSPGPFSYTVRKIVYSLHCSPYNKLYQLDTAN